MPLFEVFAKSWKQVLLGGVACMSTGSSFNLIVAFGLSYGTQTLGFSRNEMLSMVLISCVACIVLLPLFGRLSDIVGRKPVIIGGIVAEALVAFPMFWLMDTKIFSVALCGYLLMMTAFAANYGPMATFLAELFGTKVRYSGLSIAYMLSGLLGSATTPVVTTYLLATTGKGSSVAYFMIGDRVVVDHRAPDAGRDDAKRPDGTGGCGDGGCTMTKAGLLDRLLEVSFPTLGHFLEDGFAEFHVRAMVPGVKLAGRAATLRLVDADAIAVNQALARLKPGDVLVIDTGGDHAHAPVGAVTACAAQAAGATGIIVDGVVTDLLELQATRLPVFARGTTALTTKRRGLGTSMFGEAVTCGGVTVRPGDLVLADDNGVLFLDEATAEAVLEQALGSDRAEPATLARLRGGETVAAVLLGEPG